MDKYTTIDQFIGYQTRQDETNTDPRFLVEGSFNVLINDGEKVESRLGTELYGNEGVGTDGVHSSYTWKTSSGVEIPLRAFSTKLQAYLGSWTDIKTGLSGDKIRFITVWNTTKLIDELKFVNGDGKMYTWTGAFATIASTTANTITKAGDTFSQARFNTTGNLLINGTTYAYTGGVTTTTLTGVTPDPTGEANGSVMYQQVSETSDAVFAGFNPDILGVFDNRLIAASSSRRDVYTSEQNVFTNFTPDSAVQGPKDLVLDDVPTAISSGEDTFNVSADNGFIYEISFPLSAAQTAETVKVRKLKSGAQSSIRSAEAWDYAKNSVVFISQEPTLDELGRVEQYDTAQSRPLSDPIKPDFDSYNFTNVSVKYYKNAIYICLPLEGLVLVFDIRRGFWQPPQRLALSFLTIIGGELYGHSSVTDETYKLFTGTTDNGIDIATRANFAYQAYGERFGYKELTESCIEARVGNGTTLNKTLLFEYQGSDSQPTFTHSNEDDDGKYVFSQISDGGLGTAPLGVDPLGSEDGFEDELPKIRRIFPVGRKVFFEYQCQVSTDGGRYEILAIGNNVKQSTANSNPIKG